jgi:hypothetical protein
MTFLYFISSALSKFFFLLTQVLFPYKSVGNYMLHEISALPIFLLGIAKFLLSVDVFLNSEVC